MSVNITICTVNYNTSDFIVNTLNCLKDITKNNYKVIIRDNNSKLKDYLNLQKNVKNYLNVFLYRIENFDFEGSLAHGIAINDLINRIDTKYGVILDADCTFLCKNWDEILINELSEKYPIIGSQAPKSSRMKRPLDFPFMYAILFDTEIIKQLKINFIPGDDPGKKDTGYELRRKYLEKGYKGKLLLDHNTRIFKSGPFRKVICAEYYLEGYEHIFASHFGRGSSLGRSKYLKTRKNKYYKIPFIGIFLLNSKGKREKKKWIKICQNVVNKQIN